VVLGCLAVLGGSLAAAAALQAVRRGGSRLYYICAAGAAIFVIGVVGQRSFGGGTASTRSSGSLPMPAGRPGPWDAGIRLPLIEVKLTPVAGAGLLVGFAGLSVVLFTHESAEDVSANEGQSRRWEDDDAV
jgi:hypothetical protein